MSALPAELKGEQQWLSTKREFQKMNYECIVDVMLICVANLNVISNLFIVVIEGQRNKLAGPEILGV